MPREIDDTFSRSLGGTRATLVHFVEMESQMQRAPGDTITTRFCDAADEIEWDGHLWQTAGGIFKIGSVQETPDERSQMLELELSNVNRSVGALVLSHNFRGRPAKLWVAHLGDDGRVVGTPELIFKGHLSGDWRVRATRSDKLSTSTVRTTVVSPLGVLQKATPVRTNVATHRQMLERGRVDGATTDAFFSFIPMLAGKEIVWGEETLRWHRPGDPDFDPGAH